jgi:transposase
MLESQVIAADETTLKVVKEDNAKCYMWVYSKGTDSPENKLVGANIPNIVLYNCNISRAGKCAVDYLQGYSGYLQVDGYVGYEQSQATLVGCWAHARRKFKEAKTAQGKKQSGKADWALNHIQKLYRIETLIKEKTIDERHAIRQEKTLPLLAQFKPWLLKSKQTVLPKTKLGEAVTYCLNQWEKLTVYPQNGLLNTARGADASAILYSIVERAKANGLMPFDYMMNTLELIGQGDVDIESLLPWDRAQS